MILTGKTDVLGEKPVLVPLCPPQIPQAIAWNQKQASAVTDRRITDAVTVVIMFIFRLANEFRVKMRNLRF